MSAPTSTPANGVRRILFKVILLSLPFIVLMLTYLLLDPFRVVQHYRTYEKLTTAIPNRDFVSTQMYLNTYEKRPYQSFILGNSRTLAFRIGDWEPYIHDTLAYHYDASGESLYGVWKKLEFLEQHHSILKHVLLICDTQLLGETTDHDSHITQKDPRTTGASHLLFQLSFIKAYFSNAFFEKFLRQLMLGKFTPDMAEVLEKRRIFYDPVTNDIVLPDINQEIKQDSLGFYARNTKLKTTRKPGISKAVIAAEQLRQLVAVRNILMRHHTDYQIVISPLFDQKQLNPADLAMLQRIFKADRIHDYSGVNAFTSKIGNYYEDSHYRPIVGRAILKQIYTSSNYISSFNKGRAFDNSL